MLSEIDLEFFHSLPAEKKEEWLFHRTACDQSLYFFIVEMGMFAAKSGGDATVELHKPLCDWWQDDTVKRKGAFLPRDWLKSSCLTKMGNLWRYLQNNEARILLASQKLGLATSFIKFIRKQALHNPRLRYLYPILRQITREFRNDNSFGAAELEFPRKGHYSEPTFRGIGITGGSQGGHFEYVNPDDLISEKGMESPSVMEDAFRWIDNVEELLDNPNSDSPDGGVISLVGTHWSPGDLGCYIQEKYKQYKWMIIPCRKDEDLENTENITYLQNPNVEHGESNWPVERFSTKHYVDMASNPEKQLVYWSQHMNLPNRAGGLTTFDKLWLREYRYQEEDGIRYVACQDDGERFKVSSIAWYALLDPGGFSNKRLTKRSSRTAILIGGQPVGSKKKFIRYAKAFRFKETDLFMDEVFTAQTLCKPALWEQDVFAQQAYILEDIKSEAKKRGIPIRIIGMPSDARKNAKAINIEALKNPMFAGEFYVLPDMTDLLGEIQSYPGGMTKDLLDMMGKLNQLHFSRNPKVDIGELNAHNAMNAKIRSKSKTGY